MHFQGKMAKKLGMTKKDVQDLFNEFDVVRQARCGVLCP